jgi:ABC-type phosphate transport system substrate-binding protein
MVIGIEMSGVTNMFKNLILVAGLLLSSVSFAAGVVVVHPSNGDAISDKDISNIFLGKKKSFPGGSEAVPVDLAEGDATRASFAQAVLGKNASQLKAYWAKLVFTGKGTPPKAVDSAAKVKELVASNPNLIGYMDESAVDDSVKVVHKF